MIVQAASFGLALAAAVAAPAPAAAQTGSDGQELGAAEYEGWRQYSVHCARCHGQDVAGNPVAADLIKSAAPGGPGAEKSGFVEVVRAGRPKGGMPGFAKQLTEDQMGQVYAYVKGRADGTIRPGRPKKAGR
jgi:mono/diheme cytochrome c family protein